MAGDIPAAELQRRATVIVMLKLQSYDAAMNGYDNCREDADLFLRPEELLFVPEEESVGRLLPAIPGSELGGNSFADPEGEHDVFSSSVMSLDVV